MYLVLDSSWGKKKKQPIKTTWDITEKLDIRKHLELLHNSLRCDHGTVVM